MKATLHQRRDAVLGSLRAQFSVKVAGVVDANGHAMTPSMVDALLRDCANNIAQALTDEHCDECGLGPLQGSNGGLCLACVGLADETKGDI